MLERSLNALRKLMIEPRETVWRFRAWRKDGKGKELCIEFEKGTDKIIDNK